MKKIVNPLKIFRAFNFRIQAGHPKIIEHLEVSNLRTAKDFALAVSKDSVLAFKFSRYIYIFSNLLVL